MAIEKISAHHFGTREWAIDVAREYTREAAAVKPYRLRGGAAAMSNLAMARDLTSSRGYWTDEDGVVWCWKVHTVFTAASRRCFKIEKAPIWSPKNEEVQNV